MEANQEAVADRKEPPPQCGGCGIQVGPTFIEKALYRLGDMKLCSTCRRNAERWYLTLSDGTYLLKTGERLSRQQMVERHLLRWGKIRQGY